MFTILAQYLLICLILLTALATIGARQTYLRGSNWLKSSGLLTWSSVFLGLVGLFGGNDLAAKIFLTLASGCLVVAALIFGTSTRNFHLSHHLLRLLLIAGLLLLLWW